MLSIALLLMASPAVGDARPRRGSDEDPDRVVCRQAAPVVGSRVARQRLCRTVAEWRAFDADRAQMRRDLGAGNCNGDPSCSERSSRVMHPRPGPQ